ncbi:hypothetical protein BDZ89DRAFT_913861, partial [Hymenopellis radicata]
FVAGANERFGPITVIHKKGEPIKKIHWSAFRFDASDWQRLEDCTLILQDVNEIQQLFSSQRIPTMYHVIPAIEVLQTAWEKKAKLASLAPYHDAIQAGLAKIGKYYALFDKKPAYVLGLFVHPYYKIGWMRLNWGGETEQAAAIAAGDKNAKNWVKEAENIVEKVTEEYWPYRF